MSIDSVIVTGGAGCIGLEVCKQLSQRGVEVRLFDLPEQILRVKHVIPSAVKISYGSILDPSSLRDAMEGCDAVIHLAAMLGVRRTELNKLRCLDINVEGTKEILEYAVTHRLKKIVFASSSEVYGEPLQNPVNEQAPTLGSSVYAISKLMGEALCKAYAQRYPRLSYVILRYFNTYGPFQTAQFVIPKFVAGVLKDQPPTIYGNGSQKRSYSHVNDVARATVEALLREEADSHIFNIGNGERPIDLWELAHLVISVAGKPNKLVPLHQPDYNFTDRTADREISHRVCDTSKAREVLEVKPHVPLEEGLRLLLESGNIFERWETTELPYLQDDGV